jgi:hypothetical protein
MALTSQALFTILATDATDEPIAVLVVFAFGGVLLYGGFRQYRTKRLIEDTPREKVRSMAAGRTELVGVAKPREGPFECPFTAGKAVLARYEIEEYREDDDGSDWVTVDSGLLTAPFDLDDGTGSVCIDADERVTLHVSEANCTRTYVDGSETEPAPIRRFLERRPSVDANSDGMLRSLFDDRRRYTQEVVPPGTEVYVYGNASDRGGESGLETDDQRLVVGHDDTTGRFIVSDMGEKRLTTTLGRTAPLMMLIGIALLTFGFYLALSILGIAG